MHHQIIKSAVYCQHHLYSHFRKIKSKIVDTGLLLSIWGQNVLAITIKIENFWQQAKSSLHLSDIH